MLREQPGLDDLQLRFQLKRHQGQVRAAFHGDGDLDGRGGRGAPSEGSVTVDEHTGNVERVELFEAFDDDVAGFPFVSTAVNLPGSQLARDGIPPLK